MRGHQVWQAYKRDRFIQVVSIIALLLILLALFGPLFVPDPSRQDIARRLQPPGEGGLLGTDELGRSLFSRITFGLRTSLIVGALSALLGFVVGTGLGLVSGFRGGWVDSLAMRAVDVQMSLPALLLAAAIMMTTGGHPWVLVVILGLTSWSLYARVARTLVLRLRETDFVVATESLGAKSGRVIIKHLFPSIVPSMIAIGTLEFARIMLAESALSFLGFGIQPPAISIGTILAGGRDYIVTQWWVTAFAGIALAVAVLVLNLLGNWLERVSNPTATLGQELRTGPVDATQAAAVPT
jgi:peptide/nickel transport system permease protein